MADWDPPSPPTERKVLVDHKPVPQSGARPVSYAGQKNSYYDQQRLVRPSSSGVKIKDNRQAVDFENLTENVVPPPVPEQDSREHLESHGQTSGNLSRSDSYRNFSRPDAVRRNSSKSKQHGDANQNLTEEALPAPVSAPSDDRSNPPASATSNDRSYPPASATSNDRSYPPASAPSNDRSNRASAASSLSKQRSQRKHLSTGSSVGSRRNPPTDIEQDWRSNSEASAPAPPFAQGLPRDYLSERKAVPPPVSGWLTELYILSYLIFFSFLGTLARTGIQWITFYPGAPIVTPVIWANFSGSLFMGFLAEDRKLFQDEWSTSPGPTSRAEKRQSKQSRRSVASRDFEAMQRAERGKIKKTIPLYVGLTTGFCGCFTSFSVFARDMFLALSNDLPTPINHPFPAELDVSASSSVTRNGGYSFQAVAAVIIYTLALSIGGLIFGAHLALFLEDYTPKIPARFTRLFLDRVIIILGWGCWLGAILLAIWPPDRPNDAQSTADDQTTETWRGVELFSMVFAPVGCLLRYYVSIKLNGLVPSFPLGTFAVNMLGSAIQAMCWDIQHVGVGVGGSVGGGLLGCQLLQGLQDGFTGCLTTVSTWVAEINGLRRKHGYYYALASILGGLSLMVVIMGSVRWTVGWSEAVCVTGYPSKY